jgi:quercetin dioxygenase-like cupin family protein
MRPKLFGLTIVAVMGCGAAEEAVPVYEDPTHRLVFQSPLVRVLDVRVAPGETSAYHVHADRMVAVSIQGARIRIQEAGAPPGPVLTPGESPYVFENWSEELPYTHRVANVDTLPMLNVVVEWLARSGTEAPSPPDDASRRLLEEAPTTRVYEITLGPGEATAPHTHATPGLVVLGTAGTLSEKGNARATGGSGAGSWSWHEEPGPHALRNDGHTRVIIYEVDWR